MMAECVVFASDKFAVKSSAATNRMRQRWRVRYETAMKQVCESSLCGNLLLGVHPLPRHQCEPRELPEISSMRKSPCQYGWCHDMPPPSFPSSPRESQLCSSRASRRLASNPGRLHEWQPIVARRSPPFESCRIPAHLSC